METDWYRFLHMALFAFSHGHACTCATILAPASVAPGLRDKAGSLMSVATVWGSAAGAGISFLFAPAVMAQRSELVRS